MFKGKPISLRVAVLTPFILIIIVIILLLSVIIQRGYKEISYEQGNRLIDALGDTAGERIYAMLKEPLLISSLYADFIEEGKYYTDKDLKRLETIAIGMIHQIHSTIPQISTIGYGDQNKRFLGIRANDDATYTLMVKDELTNEQLVIYQSDTRQSEVVAAIDAYDPTTRPWYVPVLEETKVQWSDIYINQDELNDATISSLVPVLDDNNQLASVVCIDVSLKGINGFLKELTTESKSLMYIIDDKNRIISHSTDAAIYDTTDSEAGVDFIGIQDSDNPVMVESFREISKVTETHYLNRMKIEEDYYFFKEIPLDPTLGVNWRLIVVVPENSLVGNIKGVINNLSLIFIILMTIAVLVGGFSISTLLSPMSKLVKKVSKVDFDHLENAQIDVSGFMVKELCAFTKAYNGMILNLQESVKEIKDRENKLSVLVENSESHIFSMDKEGVLLSVNSLMNDYFHLSKPLKAGIRFTLLFNNPADQLLWQNTIEKAVSTKTTVRSLYEDAKDSEVKVVFDSRIIPVLNEQGDVQQLIGSLTNIGPLIQAQEEISNLIKTENIRLEALVEIRTQDLEKLMKELLEKEKLASLGSLVAGISHEINTPLGVAISAISYLKSINEENLKLLVDGTMTKQKLKSYIESLGEASDIIVVNLDRAKDLINSFKKIAVTTSRDDKVQFNVHEYIHSTLNSLKHELRIRKHLVNVKCETDMTLYGNPGDFHQILTNLIMNSIIHGFENLDEGVITIDVSKNSKGMRLVYGDNGKGIPKDIIEKVFDPFFTTNRGKGGSGLGLNILYNIVTGTFEGTVEIVPLEQGVEFVMNFPNSLMK